eukprot:NODE_26033_length_567_cov_2.090909.p3 GENE.NODE_26033_length_567_cov_2.090909~~NODE_26033_length_567_cov_2.090909.p3  ORF type:complete len:66 (+),score=26.18 NODE_26033_length_567_cov_2.090909:2-199(+)
MGTVLESLEEMEQGQQRKDRNQQHQLDTLSGDLQKLKVNLVHVNGQWTRYKDNSHSRQLRKEIEA